MLKAKLCPARNVPAISISRETVRQLRGIIACHQLLNEPNIPSAVPRIQGTRRDVKLPNYINLIEQAVPVFKEKV